MKKANYSDKHLVADLLTRSFDSNPSVNYIIKQDNKRTERIYKLMEYSFEICYSFGGIYLSADNKACALTLLPDSKKITFKTLWLDVQLAFSVIGLGRIRKILAREKEITKVYPKEQIYYLWFLGVEPGYQRKGIGSALLQEIIEESRLLRRPVYLETSLPENVLFYEKYNFTVYQQLTFNQVLYCMTRPYKP